MRTDRQAYALAHVADRAEHIRNPHLARTVEVAGGNLLHTILAVDR